MTRRLAMLAIVLAAVCTPRAADASIYIWKNVDGSWTDKNNWTPVDGGTTFPNAPGDQALFSDNYTAFRTATIPDGAFVIVGRIFFADRAMTIRADGNGSLRLDNGAARPQITRVGLPVGIGDVIAAPINLRNDVDIQVSDAGAHILITGAISNSGCACGITKKAPGRLFLRGANSYLGTTSIEGGQLVLDLSDTPVIRGALEIGTGEAATQIVAEVLISKEHQIADTSTVLVKSQGLLTVDVPERVGDTTILDGSIVVRTPAGLFVPGALRMTGGTIESRGDGVIRLDSGQVFATSSALRGAARIHRGSGNGVLNLGATTDVFEVNQGPSTSYDLSIDLPITGSGFAGMLKRGAGRLRLAGNNTYPGATQVHAGQLFLEPPAGGQSIAGDLYMGGVLEKAVVDVRSGGAIADTSEVTISSDGSLWINASTPEVTGRVNVFNGGSVLVGNLMVGARLVTPILSMKGGLVQASSDNNTIEVTTTLTANSDGQEGARIEGGTLVLGGTRTIGVVNGPAPIDLRVTSKIAGGAADGLKKEGTGIAVFTANNPYGGTTTIAEGTLIINGQQPTSQFVLLGGAVGGVGKIGSITAGDAEVSPGQSPGRLSSGSLSLTFDSTFDIELSGTAAGTYDQLAATGTVNLAGALLRVTPGGALPAGASWTILENDGVDPIVGTFFRLPEGGDLAIGGQRYRITYRGGDGNDVVIETAEPPSYYLAEGATGDFFDDDVLIANPNLVEAPVTMTLLREGGATVVIQRVIPARSRVTIHVDEIEGLEDVSASVKVQSTSFLPLVVERSMFWDASYYGGHTANAVARPEKQWTFAEGFQGFFDTYLLIANANAAKTTATLTFLRENDTPVVKTVEVDPFQRKTIYAGDYDELKGRAFGIVVDATEPVIAERAMYFANQPNRIWAGGHVNTGIVAPSNSWFHAEGATGTFFNTFILLSNPQTSEADVDVKFLLADGTVITRKKTLAPQQRLTINPATEGDSRLENAALSTVVQSSVPIVSERSMYWEGDVRGALGEGHNSSGVTETGKRWGLAEGRVGGARNFVTYILLANPNATAAKVRVSYLRENGGAPIVKEYDVPATSRFNIDVRPDVPELDNTSFAADIEVINGVPIAVERSLYWDARGALWAGGTNALATPLPEIP